MTVLKERRQTDRIAFPCAIKYDMGEVLPAWLEDVSPQGAAMVCTGSPPEFEKVELIFLGGNVAVDARIIYWRPGQNRQFRVGMVFDQDQPELVEVMVTTAPG